MEIVRIWMVENRFKLNHCKTELQMDTGVPRVASRSCTAPEGRGPQIGFLLDLQLQLDQQVDHGQRCLCPALAGVPVVALLRVK